MLRRMFRRCFAIAIACFSLTSCGVIYPEFGTRLGQAPAIGTFDPPPPPDRHYLSTFSALIPNKARDGRPWRGSDPNSAPRGFLKLFINDTELLRTSVEADTLTPTWPDTKRGNYAFKEGDALKVEIWDDFALNDRPIMGKKLEITRDMLELQEVDVQFDNGGSFKMKVEPAKPVWGAGFWYELRTGAAYITRTMPESPASRAGLLKGDRIITIAGKDVSGMSADEVKGLMNTIPTSGLELAVQHSDGGTLRANVKEGPIYPLVADYGDPLAPR
jgi:hypothetical protein